MSAYPHKGIAWSQKEKSRAASRPQPNKNHISYIPQSLRGCLLYTSFWDVKSGSVKIGGHDVREFTCDSLLSYVSMVFQKVYLFNDTIENNIKFGKPNASHAEVVAAAKRACCHDFIEALPQGYETMIGEAGSTLSGGEKQRISIARAILKDAPIIILDEATSSVDPENEKALLDAIFELTKNKTLISIAHRLSTCLFYTSRCV